MKTNRLGRVLQGMEKMGLNQILVSATDSVYYLTGLWVNPGERLYALSIDKNGDCALYVNRMFRLSGQAPGLHIVEFDDVDDPVKLLSEGIRAGTLGVDKLWPSHFAIKLMEARPDVKLAVGSKPVDDARMLKDREEMEAMRLSSRVNDETVKRLRETLVLGESELDVGRRYVQLGAQKGAKGAGFTPLVCFGENCAEPHHASDSTALKDGDAVILDLGLDVNHHMSDMTRTVFMGSVTDEMKKVYDVVLQANMAAKAAVRPGALMRDIDRAARKLIEDAGYGAYFLHRTGHGIGLAVHEPPYVTSASDVIAQPGMVFSIEPGVYLAGKFGVRIEDLVHVTEDGCEVLNHLDRELMVIK